MVQAIQVLRFHLLELEKVCFYQVNTICLFYAETPCMLNLHTLSTVKNMRTY